MSGLPALASAVSATVAQSGSLTSLAVQRTIEVVGLSLVAAGLAAAVALVYRWYARERVPGGLPALFGLSGVAVFLNTDQALGEVITPDGNGDPLDQAAILFHVVTFLVALAATRAGTDVGDRIGNDLTVATGERAVESEVGRVVQAVGRVITVELPEEIEDIVGYDPVPAKTKEALAGKTFVFPRRLTVDELRGRLVTRLKADYAVGHVDVDLADDGTVEYLAVGSRAAGIGPTLPPETSAVAVQADPAFAASAGDLVQVWGTDPFERVLTAEVRGTVDDVVTLAVDAADTRKLDAEARYKLVTLPVEARPDREFASVLRAADETMAAVTVAEGSALAGQPVGALDVTIVAVRPREGAVEPLPARDRVLGAGDALYLVAAPEAIRKVEQAASPRVAGPAAGSTAPSAGSGAQLAPDEQVDATTPVASESPDPSGTAREDGDRKSAPDASADLPSDAEADSGTAATPAEPTDAASEPAGSTDVDDLSDADAPGTRTLEADEPDGDGERAASTASDSTPATGSEDDSSDDEPTREDLNDLAGVDVDDLTGTDVTVDTGGESDESPDESADGADDELVDDDPADAEEVGEAGDADDTGDDGGWTVAVDERRDADAGR